MLQGVRGIDAPGAYVHLSKSSIVYAYENWQGTCRLNFKQFAETFNFTKMTPKLGENWLMKCIVVFSFWGLRPQTP